LTARPGQQVHRLEAVAQALPVNFTASRRRPSLPASVTLVTWRRRSWWTAPRRRRRRPGPTTCTRCVCGGAGRGQGPRAGGGCLHLVRRAGPLLVGDRGCGPCTDPPPANCGARRRALRSAARGCPSAGILASARHPRTSTVASCPDSVPPGRAVGELRQSHDLVEAARHCLYVEDLSRKVISLRLLGVSEMRVLDGHCQRPSHAPPLGPRSDEDRDRREPSGPGGTAPLMIGQVPALRRRRPFLQLGQALRVCWGLCPHHPGSGHAARGPLERASRRGHCTHLSNLASSVAFAFLPWPAPSALICRGASFMTPRGSLALSGTC